MKRIAPDDEHDAKRQNIGPREPYLIARQSLGPDDFSNLRKQLQEVSNHRRNWTLCYLHTLECDFPIIEAVSMHWPGSFAVTICILGHGMHITISKIRRINGGRSYQHEKTMVIYETYGKHMEAEKNYFIGMDYAFDRTRTVIPVSWVEIFARVGLVFCNTTVIT